MGIKIRQKDLDMFNKEFIKEDWKIDRILQTIHEAYTYYNNMKKQDRERKATLRKAKSAYIELDKSLAKMFDGGEAKNPPLGNIPNPEIRLQVLRLVYKHNAKIYAAMQQEYEELSAHDASHYQVLLSQYGISPESYEVASVMDNSIEDVEAMLEALKKMQITSPNDLLKILQESDRDTVGTISAFIQHRVISTELILRHINVFNPTSIEMKNIAENLKTSQEKQFSQRYIIASKDGFMTPYQAVRENVQVLEDYELTPLMRSGMDCSFLAESNLKDAIDILLELGYEKNLEENIELLNYKDRFARLKVVKALNIPVESTEYLLQLLTTDKFFVPEDKIDDYIYNAVDHNLPSAVTLAAEPKKKSSDLAKLSEYSYTSRTYSIDGVLISKNKVLRNLSTIAATGKQSDRLLYGLIKGSTLTDEEFAKVEANVAPKKSSGATKQKQ